MHVRPSSQAWISAGMMALALGACGPKAETTAPASGSTEAAAVAPKPDVALDPCAGQLKALCADKDLAPLSGQMKTALFEAASAVSPEGAQILANNQQSWLEAQRVACGLKPGATAVDDKQQECLKTALADRVKEANDSVEKVGPFTFQRVEINQTSTLVETAAAEAMGPGAPSTVSRDIKFPRIDGDSPAIRKFNEAVKQSPRFKLEDQTEEQTTYKIAYAGDDLVSVRFETYDYAVGAAHPNASVEAVSINMTTGAPVTAADIFKPGAKWQDFITARAAREINAQLKAEDDSAGVVSPDDVRKVVVKPDAWLITDKALVVLFAPYSVGPWAVGAHEVSIPWKTLKPYLNPNGPGPIKGA